MICSIHVMCAKDGKTPSRRVIGFVLKEFILYSFLSFVIMVLEPSLSCELVKIIAFSHMLSPQLFERIKTQTLPLTCQPPSFLL